MYQTAGLWHFSSDGALSFLSVAAILSGAAELKQAGGTAWSLEEKRNKTAMS